MEQKIMADEFGSLKLIKKSYDEALNFALSRPLFGSFSYDEGECTQLETVVKRFFFRLIAVTAKNHLFVQVRTNLNSTRPKILLLPYEDFYCMVFESSPLIPPSDLDMEMFQKKFWSKVKWFLPNPEDPSFALCWRHNKWKFNDVSFPKLVQNLCFPATNLYFETLRKMYPESLKYPPLILPNSKTLHPVRVEFLSCLRWPQLHDDIRIPGLDGEHFDFSCVLVHQLVHPNEDYYFPHCIKFWLVDSGISCTTSIPLCEMMCKLRGSEQKHQKLIKEGKVTKDQIFWTRSNVDLDNPMLPLSLRLLKQWAFYLGVAKKPDPIFSLSYSSSSIVMSDSMMRTRSKGVDLVTFIRKRLIKILSKTWPDISVQEKPKFPYRFMYYEMFWKNFILEYAAEQKINIHKIQVTVRWLTVINFYIHETIVENRLDGVLDSVIASHQFPKVEASKFAEYQKNINILAKKQAEEDEEQKRKEKQKQKPCVIII